ncbi:MAG TPA: hypothetical protein VIW24_28755 [Aldersonia sp.]
MRSRRAGRASGARTSAAWDLDDLGIRVPQHPGTAAVDDHASVMTG